jgi:hypothetical protein
MTKMMDTRFGILFLHYQVDPVAENNLRSIQFHNPDATIATISSGEPLPGGYTLEPTPELKALHALYPRRSSDRLVCSWFQQRKEACDKWWIVEWDLFCGVSAKEYYRPVWDFPFVASAVRLAWREGAWYWFKKIREQNVPDGYEPFLMGAVPFIYLISEPALKAVCTMLLENPWSHGNAELRFATAANKCGYPPCGYSPPNDRISWVPWKTMPEHATIVHPVKFFHDTNRTNLSLHPLSAPAT